MGKRKGKSEPAAKPSSPCAPEAPGAPPARRPRLVGWRKWALRGALLILSPALALALLEAGLRWAAPTAGPP